MTTHQNDRSNWIQRDQARATIVEAAIERLTGQDLATLSALQLARAEVELDLLILYTAQPRNDGSLEARRHWLACAVARESSLRCGVSRADWRQMLRDVRGIYRELRPDLELGL